MSLLRLRLVDAGGGAPGFGRSLLRLVGALAAVAFVFVGFLPVLVDDRRRALQDFLARTVVIYDTARRYQALGRRVPGGTTIGVVGPPGEEAIVSSELELKRVLYTADALVEGGRDGHGRTSDGRLEVDLSVPAAMSGDDGPGTNPEQLFAVGYAACFQSALLAVARGRNIDASGSQIASRVGIGHAARGGFGLQVWLDLRGLETPFEEARELMLLADQRCPYSNATRGNVAVTLSVAGRPV